MRLRLLPLLLLQSAQLETSTAFTVLSRQRCHPPGAATTKGFDWKRSKTVLFAEDSSNSSSEEEIRKSTSFDDAGRSLIEEEDKKRMEEMGDFDSNPEVSSKHANWK